MASIFDFLGIGVDEIEFTPEEIQAQQIAFDSFVQADTEGKELTPFVLATMGLARDADTGSLRNLTPDEFASSLDPISQKNYENLNLQLDRQNRALKGELPESEILAKKKQDAFDQAKQSLAERGLQIEGDTLESAVGTSTPAIQTLEALKTEFGLRSDVENRDIIERGNTGILANLATTSDLRQRNLTNLSTFPNRRSSVLSGSAAVQQPFQNQAGSNAQIQSVNASGASSILGGAATIGGFGLLKKFGVI